MKILKQKKRKGSILVIVLIFSALSTIGSMAAIQHIKTDLTLTFEKNDSIKAFYCADAGIEHAKRKLYNDFVPYFNSQDQNINSFLWFDSLYGSYIIPTGTELQGSTGYGQGPVSSYSVKVTDVSNIPEGRKVTLLAEGTYPTQKQGLITRKIEVEINYAMETSSVFDYTYFINNFGWFSGGGITSNGDLRSNGNIELQGNPEVNGDLYAANNPALSGSPQGTITGSYGSLTLSQYRQRYTNADSRARPTDPPADGEEKYPAGYSGQSEHFEEQDPLHMPYMGNLSTYKTIAQQENGTISQDGAILVSAVYEGTGPDGIDNTPDDGCLVLIGTEEHPIVINGPVVVEKDVLIKGVISGQGTIYSGRNTHVLGDINYANPPGWPKPDTTPEQTAANNAGKDILGLVSKGSFVVGDYTTKDWQNSTTAYLQPPFVDPYDVDPSDAVNGYTGPSHFNGVLDPGEDINSNGTLDPGEDIARSLFHGNYTAEDGGSKDDGKGSAENRKFYESSLSDDWMNKNAEKSSSIRNIDAITYTNHAWAGKVGNFNLNGNLTSRNEAIIFSGDINFFYDVRIHSNTKLIDISLPKTLSSPEVVSWKEV